jgi:hypothetical protein
MRTRASGHLGRWRAHVLASAGPFLVAAVVGGCATEAGSNLSTTTTSLVSPPVSEPGSSTATSYAVDALGLRFDLPENYVAVEDDELEFLARSSAPLSIFSIDREEPGTTHEPEAGESVSEMRLGDLEAQVVENAVVDGLPPGVAANELFVDNGPQSFSVIMSAVPSELAGLWDPFIASVQVEPAA